MLMKAADFPVVNVRASGAMWRLRSLVAMGHSNLRMARALGVHKDVVNRLVSGDVVRVTAEMFNDVSQLWEAWWDKRPPERNQHERAAATKARRKAKARKWPTPLNLDEDHLDELGYRPTADWHPASGVCVADDFPLGFRGEAA
jgi:plasmid maintenance system antidote protein VapI